MMEQLFEYGLIPLLAVITALFSYFVFKASRIADAQERHFEATAQGFEYANQAFGVLDSGVKDLNTKIENAVLPKIEGVYDRLASLGLRLSPDTLLRYFHDSGLTTAQFLTKDKSMLVLGSVDPDTNRKITILLGLVGKNTRLDITFFSFWLSNPSEKVLLDLLKINAVTAVGKIAIQKYADKHLISVQHTLLAPNGQIDPEQIRSTFARLFETHELVARLVDSYSLARNELLIADYVKLLKGSQIELPALVEEKMKDE